MFDNYTIDVHSPTWAVVKTTIEKELKSARDTLEDRGLDEAKTQCIRGQIIAYREILSLGEQNSD